MCVLVSYSIFTAAVWSVVEATAPPHTCTSSYHNILHLRCCHSEKKKKKTKTKTSPFYALLQSFIYSIEISNTITIAQQHYYTTATNIIARRGH